MHQKNNNYRPKTITSIGQKTKPQALNDQKKKYNSQPVLKDKPASFVKDKEPKKEMTFKLQKSKTDKIQAPIKNIEETKSKNK